MKMFSAVVACAVTSFFMVQAAFGLDLEEMQDIALSKRELVKRYQINMEKSQGCRSGAGAEPAVHRFFLSG